MRYTLGNYPAAQSKQWPGWALATPHKLKAQTSEGWAQGANSSETWRQLCRQSEWVRIIHDVTVPLDALDKFGKVGQETLEHDSPERSAPSWQEWATQTAASPGRARRFATALKSQLCIKLRQAGGSPNKQQLVYWLR
jgi:hypothetical protein